MVIRHDTESIMVIRFRADKPERIRGGCPCEMNYALFRPEPQDFPHTLRDSGEAAAAEEGCRLRSAAGPGSCLRRAPSAASCPDSSSLVSSNGSLAACRVAAAACVYEAVAAAFWAANAAKRAASSSRVASCAQSESSSLLVL